MHQTPRKFGRAQTTDPAEFSWCRAGVSASIEPRHGQGRATASTAPSDQNAKDEPDHQWLLRLNQLLELLILLPGHFAPSQPLLQNL